MSPRSRSGIAYDTREEDATTRVEYEHQERFRNEEIYEYRFVRYWTYHEIAKRFRITPERVRQIVAREVARREAA
jgi:DNA-directed RNA polymerase sigma subunit (sigma70/sigma32)